MIPFVLGMITGFLAAVLLMVIYAVTKSSSEMSRKEESWNEQEQTLHESDE